MVALNVVFGVCSVGLAHTNHGPFLSCSWNVGWSVNKFIVFHPDKKEGKSEESQGPMLIFASLKGFSFIWALYFGHSSSIGF